MRMRQPHNKGFSSDKQLALLALKMENARLKKELKEQQEKVEMLKRLCRAMSTFDMGDGTHANQFGRVPIYDIAKCFEYFPGSPLGDNARYKEHGWTMYEV